jgi:putative ABC transport system substrate-binding protein
MYPVCIWLTWVQATLRRFFGAWIVLFSLMLAAPAASDGVVVLLSEDSPPYRETAEALRSVLELSSAAHRIPCLTLQSAAVQADNPALKGADLIVTVGMQATQMLADAPSTAPILATLVPKQSIDKLLSQHKHEAHGFSAIYIDQPVARQLALFKIGLPGRKKLGVILGTETQDRFKLLQAGAHEQKIQLVAETINAEDELIPALQRVLAESDALLALPDPLAFNKNNAYSILLTSYRYQAPVIGYSQAYVKAGALMAVYSNPAQIGHQAGEMLLRFLASKAGGLPAPQYPKYFSVSVNNQVARSLGIRMEDETVLTEKLKRVLEQEP